MEHSRRSHHRDRESPKKPNHVKDYGVWVARPIGVNLVNKYHHPHLHLSFSQGDGQTYEADINVRSYDQDSRVVWWHDGSFTHPITQQLQNLEEGFYPLFAKDGLDFIRMKNLLPGGLQGGSLLSANVPNDVSRFEDANQNVIVSRIERVLSMVDGSSGARVYIFGSHYQDPDGTRGIHEVHMNQGSKPQYENSTFTDGALIVQFPDGHFEAVFLAFASQRVPTDDLGLARQDSQELAAIVRHGDGVAGGIVEAKL